MTGKAPLSRHRLSYPSSQIFKEQRIGLSPEDAKRRKLMLRVEDFALPPYFLGGELLGDSSTAGFDSSPHRFTLQPALL